MADKVPTAKQDLLRELTLETLQLVQTYADVAANMLFIDDDQGALTAMRKLLACTRTLALCARDLKQEAEK